MESISEIYETKPKSSIKLASNEHYFKDSESLLDELKKVKTELHESIKEKKWMTVKIKHLEEALAKLEQPANETYNPYEKNGNAISLDSKLKSTIRQQETKIKQLDSELEKVRKSLRYTKLVELENELIVYYQEVRHFKLIVTR
jgi:hypothetical protein